MLASPEEILTAFPVRKTSAQKRQFRAAVQSYAQVLAYPCCEETGSLGSSWLVIGDPETALVLILAGKEASTVWTVLEILRTLPENRRNRAAFVLYDGFFGRRSYCSAHKEAVSNQLVIQLDSVAHGDILRMIPTRNLNQDRKKLTSLYKACGYFGKKSLLVQEKSLLPATTPYPLGVAVCTIPSGKKETYRNRIRETESTIPDQTNINILRAALVSFLCCDAAQ